MLTLQQAQHQLENSLGITGEERLWIMRNKAIPAVRNFWVAYKRALNFVHDTDKITLAKTHLSFIRSIKRSGFELEDPRYSKLFS